MIGKMLDQAQAFMKKQHLKTNNIVFIFAIFFCLFRTQIDPLMVIIFKNKIVSTSLETACGIFKIIYVDGIGCWVILILSFLVLIFNCIEEKSKLNIDNANIALVNLLVNSVLVFFRGQLYYLLVGILYFNKNYFINLVKLNLYDRGNLHSVYAMFFLSILVINMLFYVFQWCEYLSQDNSDYFKGKKVLTNELTVITTRLNEFEYTDQKQEFHELSKVEFLVVNKSDPQYLIVSHPNILKRSDTQEPNIKVQSFRSALNHDDTNDNFKKESEQKKENEYDDELKREFLRKKNCLPYNNKSEILLVTNNFKVAQYFFENKKCELLESKKLDEKK